MPTIVSPSVPGVFAREGAYWTLAYADRLIRLADSKGLRQMAHLLRNPGRQIHALDLMASTDPLPEQSESAARNEASDLSLRNGAQGDTGDLLDAKARSAYTQRLGELREERDEARELGIESRALKAQAEIDALTSHLRTSFGIGGRARRTGSAAERARLAVSKSIGRALESIAAANPELGQLLETTIKTGTFCCYQPDPRFPVEWRFDEPDKVAVAEPLIGAALSEVRHPSSNGAEPIPSDSLDSRSITPWGLAIGAAVCIVVITMAFAYRARHHARGSLAATAHVATAPTVAVLPFTNLSANRDDEYFSDGMTDEIIGDLSKIRGLKVAASTSSFVFKGRSEAADKIAGLLHVRNLLEGSVRRSSNKLRIEVELIDAPSGFTIWSERYDRDLADVFAIQSDVAESVSEKLRVSLLPGESARVKRKPTDNPEAYDLYLQGLYFEGRFSEEDDQKAIGYYKRAIALDPGFARAHASLANTYVNSTDWHFAPRESEPIIKAEAERALALDDQLAEAHDALGFYLVQYEWNWPAAEREYRRAIDLAPDSLLTHNNYGFALGYMGRYDDALEEMHRASEIAPLDPLLLVFAGDVYAMRHDYPRARQLYQRVVEMLPDAWVGYWDRARVAAYEGNVAAAIKDMEKSASLTNNPMVKSYLAGLYAHAGRTADALRILAELQEASKHRFVSPVCFGGIYWFLGDKERAFRSLEEAYDGRSTFLTQLRDPSWDYMREDPRFMALEKKIGLYE